MILFDLFKGSLQTPLPRDQLERRAVIVPTRRWIWCAIFFSFVLVSATLPTAGESEPASYADVESNASVEEAPVVAASEATRVVRIEGVIDLDRKKLAELEASIAERQGFFDDLADRVRSLDEDLSAKRARLDEIGESDDAGERTRVEAEIAELEEEQVLVRTQSELAFASLATIREQIEALEKKIEREQRALDVLERTAPRAPAAPLDRAGSEQAARPSLPPLVPGLPQAASTAAPVKSVAFIETTAQVEAAREYEQRQREAFEAQQAVIEFVKRSESLEEQIVFETELLDTAKSSVENLERAIESRKADLELASAEGGSASDVLRLRKSLARIEGLLDDAEREIDERSAYLDSLKQRQERLREEEVSVTQNASATRDAVNLSRARLRWVQSPLHPSNVLRWGRDRGPRILLVLVTIVVLLSLIRFGIGRVMHLLVRRSHDRSSPADRAETLALSFRSASSFVIVVGGALLLFQEAGVDIVTVLGGAAIFGVAVAFGAQNLMRDYFTGFLLLMENQFELGDLVTIGGITGTVESVNMRVTMLRDLEGRVHFIPNGEIKAVTNRTYNWGRAVVEVPVAYGENVDRVMA
ncbi:MAG: mechanosensitive ion channel, partial [Actinomycetota bacterium]|nr:mechanosensitive ion channel [Actinomycetota bacterium]